MLELNPGKRGRKAETWRVNPEVSGPSNRCFRGETREWRTGYVWRTDIAIFPEVMTDCGSLLHVQQNEVWQSKQEACQETEEKPNLHFRNVFLKYWGKIPLNLALCKRENYLRAFHCGPGQDSVLRECSFRPGGPRMPGALICPILLCTAICVPPGCHSDTLLTACQGMEKVGTQCSK